MYNKMESKEAEEKNCHYSNIVSGLALSYSRATKSEERIRILSCVANNFTNKDLKAKFRYKTNCENEVSCTDYEITQARLHSQIFGPGLEKPPHKKMPRQFYTPVEDIAFLLDFIHSSDCVEPSSYRTATCEGKRKSWISDLMGGGSQPVLWLKQNKNRLYEKYAEESKRNRRRTISKTMFYQGLEAGNFRELQEMAGLCNICTEYGAENFDNLYSVVDKLEKEWYIINKEKPNLFSKLKLRVKKFKGYLLSDFQKNLKQHDKCASHCMTWQLGGDCKDH